MLKLGRHIFYDLQGIVILDTGERVVPLDTPTTNEEYIKTYSILSERNRDSFDVLELEYGQYAQDFAESNGYRVNPETKELEFSYPDPNEPEAPPEYRPPLSVEIEEMKVKMQMQDATMEELMFIIIPELNGGGL